MSKKEKEVLHHGDSVTIEYTVNRGSMAERVEVVADWSANYGFLLRNASVAALFGCSEDNVRKHKLKDEVVGGGHHYILESEAFPERPLQGRPATYWTINGVYRLGMFISGDRASAFRDAMEETLTQLELGNQGEMWDRDDEARALMGKESRRPAKTPVVKGRLEAPKSKHTT